MKTLRTVFLADCQSFYASVEKPAHPEYRNKPLVVAGDPERRSGIILAACPIAKKFGVTTAERLGESLAKCPDLIIIKPRMQEYIDISLQITAIYQTFTDLVEPYSIDEQFVDVTGSLHLFGSSVEIAKQMQDAVMAQTGVYIRVGISENKILAKTSCDNFAKKVPGGIFTLSKAELPSTLWPLPIDKMFMVGSKMTYHFNRMGIYTIGELAAMPLGRFKDRLHQRMGKQSDIQAELFWRIANGHDDSKVTVGTHDKQKSIGHQMTLPRDYYKQEEIFTVLLELAELVCQHSRAKGYMGWVVTVGCQGADFDHPTGFYRQMRFWCKYEFVC